MLEVIAILKNLCGEDKALFNEVSDEIKEALTFEIVDGIRTVNTKAALEFAFQLECSQYPATSYNRKATCSLLSRNSLNPELIYRLLGKEGVEVRGNRDAG